MTLRRIDTISAVGMLAATTLAAGIVISPTATTLGSIALAVAAIAAAWPRAALGLAVVAALLSPSLEALTGVSAVGFADEATSLLVALATGVRALSRGQRLHRLPGQRWFLAYVIVGALSSFIERVPFTVAGPSAFLFAKGFLLGWAAIQLSWNERELHRWARAAMVLAALVLTTAAANLAVPGPWSEALANTGAVDYRYGLPSLIGPFVHPGSFGHVTALLAVAGVAWASTEGRRRSGVVVAALGVLSVLSFRRKAFVSLLAGLAGVRLSAQRTKTVVAIAVVAPLFLIALADPLTAVIDDTRTEYEGVTARTALYQGSVEVAADQAPLGVGFGRYGSFTAGQQYSPVYERLGFEGVYGLGPQDSFASDTFWPAILGETGFAGLVAYALFLLALLRFFRSLRIAGGWGRTIGLTGIGWSAVFAVESIAAPVYVSPPSFPLLFVLAGIGAGWMRTSARSHHMLRPTDQTLSTKQLDGVPNYRDFQALSQSAWPARATNIRQRPEP